jgi:flavin-binding protein dodecin
MGALITVIFVAAGVALVAQAAGPKVNKSPRVSRPGLNRTRAHLSCGYIAFARLIPYLLAGPRPLLIHQERTIPMSVARVTEITSSSTQSFEDAIEIGISRANKTLQNVKGAWIQDQKVVVESGKITEYRVNMKVTFVLKS